MYQGNQQFLHQGGRRILRTIGTEEGNEALIGADWPCWGHFCDRCYYLFVTTAIYCKLIRRIIVLLLQDTFIRLACALIHPDDLHRIFRFSCGFLLGTRSFAPASPPQKNRAAGLWPLAHCTATKQRAAPRLLLHHKTCSFIVVLRFVDPSEIPAKPARTGHPSIDRARSKNREQHDDHCSARGCCCCQHQQNIPLSIRCRYFCLFSGEWGIGSGTKHTRT